MLATASPLEQSSRVSSGSLDVSSEQDGSSLLAERRAPQRSGPVSRAEWAPTFPQHHAWEQSGGVPMPAAGSGCGRE